MISFADKTPTPIRLIKNFEEVGLFEDLCHVNPFEETFRRACEQNQTGASKDSQGQKENLIHDEDSSLHTPQVYPQFETFINRNENHSLKSTLTNTCGQESALIVDESESTLAVSSDHNSIEIENSAGVKNREFSLAEENSYGVQQNDSFNLVPPNIQFIQPQLITVQFSNSNQQNSTDHLSSLLTQDKSVKNELLKTKPYILPKPLPTIKVSSSEDKTQSDRLLEPSSASLTPTSQLPIKERLKAIVSQSTKHASKLSSRNDSSEANLILASNGQFLNSNYNRKSNLKSKSNVNHDFLERRRAASSRYRHRVRCEQKDLKNLNMELRKENDQLRTRIDQLEKQLQQLQKTTSKNSYICK